MDLSQLIQNLIETYLDRQILVYTVMQQLQPQKLALLEWLDRDLTPPPSVLVAYHAEPKLSKGRWGQYQEWEYIFHGSGCQLIHTHTHEPIEWDAPNPTQFNRDWFFNWLAWWITKYPESDSAQTLQQVWQNSPDARQWVYTQLEVLAETGLLSSASLPCTYQWLSSGQMIYQTV